MPELPEVETIRRQLAPLVEGRTLRALDVLDPKWCEPLAPEALVDGLDTGLVFANLVDTDQRFGHRKDVEGFHGALREIDAVVGDWLERLRPADLLVLTADHGCDPDAAHSDHTREHVPLLARFEGDGGRRHDGALADVGASVLRWLTGRDVPGLPGTAFVALDG